MSRYSKAYFWGKFLTDTIGLISTLTQLKLGTETDELLAQLLLLSFLSQSPGRPARQHYLSCDRRHVGSNPKTGEFK